MPQKLSERIEDKVREHIVQNATPSEMQGYDPTQTDTTASDFILVTSDNDNYGDYYPMIFVSENDNGPTIPNAGNTNYNGLQGDGSGANTYAIHNVSISVQAVENGPYLNNTAYDDLAFEIYQELRSIFTVDTQLSETMWTGALTPGTQNRSSEEQDNSTETWYQESGTIPVGVHYTP